MKCLNLHLGSENCSDVSPWRLCLSAYYSSFLALWRPLCGAHDQAPSMTRDSTHVRSRQTRPDGRPATFSFTYPPSGGDFKKPFACLALVSTLPSRHVYPTLAPAHRAEENCASRPHRAQSIFCKRTHVPLMVTFHGRPRRASCRSPQFWRQGAWFGGMSPIRIPLCDIIPL